MTKFIQPSHSRAAIARALGAKAERWTGMGGVMSIRPASGLRKRIFRRASSCDHSTVSPRSMPRTTRRYSRSADSFMGPRPIVSRAVNPVPMPSAIRPGASLFSEASPLAATGAMRLVGTRTPGPIVMRRVLAAASAMATNTSAHRSCVS